MKSKEKLGQIVMDVYRELYREAEPSSDLDELIRTEETAKHNWFENYYLSEERQVVIIEEITTSYKLTKREKYLVSKEVHLGCAPSCVRKVTE